jgi:hypothetical protein
MKLLFSLFLLLVCHTLSSASETITFDIFLFGNKIGRTNITREVKPDGSEFYSLDTKSKAKILWITRENHTQYEVIYKSGQLISSKVTEVENGKTKRWTNVNWDGTKYLVDSYKGRFIFTEIPSFSIATIFFKDISGVKRVFYETEADFSNLTKTAEPDTYELKSSDGYRYIYQFSNGKIQAMEMHVLIATIKMIRVH